MYHHTVNSSGSTGRPVWNEYRRIHMLGIGGSGMWSLGMLLHSMGYTVTGTDKVTGGRIRKLSEAGIRIYQEHEHPGSTAIDCMVYSIAVPADHPIRTWGRAHGIPERSYPQALADFFNAKDGIAVAGTHGKSTTSAMVASVLTHAGRDPQVIVGGETLDGIHGYRFGAGSLFVAEACEFRRSFLNLHPRYAILTNVEADHLDFYQDVRSIRDAFETFLRGMKPDASVIYFPDAVQLTFPRHVRRVRYGWRPQYDWWADMIDDAPPGIRYRVHAATGYVGHVALPVPGRHNVLNSLSVFALGQALAVPPEVVAAGLGRFRGVARRFQTLGERQGIVVIDDYAHHPTELRATFETAKTVYPDRKIWFVFQPHQYSRTLQFYDDFVRVLTRKDSCELLVCAIYGVRESDELRRQVSHKKLVDDIGRNGGKVRAADTLEDALDVLEKEVRAGDVVVSIGAGDVWKVAQGMVARLS